MARYFLPEKNENDVKYLKDLSHIMLCISQKRRVQTFPDHEIVEKKSPNMLMLPYNHDRSQNVRQDGQMSIPELVMQCFSAGILDTTVYFIIESV